MQASHGLLKLAPRGGRNRGDRKNVPAPAPRRPTASKAAMNHLTRRHCAGWGRTASASTASTPTRSYDTALWTDELLPPPRPTA